jgi:hypothetical protein
MTFLKAVLLEGDFITALPRAVLRQELESSALVSIPYPGGPVRTVEGIIYRAEAVHPPALFVLTEAIKAENAAFETELARHVGRPTQHPPVRNGKSQRDRKERKSAADRGRTDDVQLGKGKRPVRQSLRKLK